MLTSLPASGSAARAASQLTRRRPRPLAAAKQGPCRRHASSFAASAAGSSSMRNLERDLEGGETRPPSDQRNSKFSHFFDRRSVPHQDPLSTSTRPKASYEISAASHFAVSSFRQAISSREPAKIIEAYEQVRRQHQIQHDDITSSTSRSTRATQIKFPIRKADIQTAIKTLVHQASQKEGLMTKKDAEACHQMFEDMDRLFGFEIRATDLHRELQVSCLDTRRDVDPFEAFQDLRAKSTAWKTASVDWNVMISALVQRKAYSQAVKAWKQMQEEGIEPEAALRNTMIKIYLRLGKTTEAELQMQEITGEKERAGIDTLTTIVKGLCNVVSEGGKLKASDYTVRLHSYASKLRTALDSGPGDRSAWHALLHYEALTSGPTHALTTAQDAHRPGRFDLTTLCVLLRLHTADVSDLQSSDDALDLLSKVQSAIDPKGNISPDAQCYAILIQGLLCGSADGPTPNQVHESQTLYNHARSIGVPPTPLLITPLLNAYCNAFLPSLTSAMALVRDVVNHQDNSKRHIGMKIIGPVIDACVQLRDGLSARTFLSLLSSANVPLALEQKISLIQRLLPISTSWSEAFRFYRTLTCSFGEAPLDSTSHFLILKSFLSLSFADPAPPEDLLQLLLTHPCPSSSVYTTVLDYYSKSTPPSYSGIRATHELLKRDEALEPDLPLINALMNAYNRTDEPSMVIAIWESLLATRQGIDGVTLSVIFDTAGRYGLLSLARKAIGHVRRLDEAETSRGRSIMTKGAWDSYLECLARCGRLEEAIEIVFGEMRRALFKEASEAGAVDDYKSVGDLISRSSQAPITDKKGEVIGPDSKTFETLLQFAAQQRDRRQTLVLSNRSSGSSIWHTLRNRIREEYSWLYPRVQHVGE